MNSGIPKGSRIAVESQYAAIFGDRRGLLAVTPITA
jgi:hypothetical protein